MGWGLTGNQGTEIITASQELRFWTKRQNLKLQKLEKPNFRGNHEVREPRRAAGEAGRPLGHTRPEHGAGGSADGVWARGVQASRGTDGTLSPRPVHTERPQPEPTGYADAVNTGQDGSWTGSTDGAGRWEQGHCRARQPRLEQQWARGPLGKQRLNSRWSRRASAFQKRSLWTSSGIGMGGSC